MGHVRTAAGLSVAGIDGFSLLGGITHPVVCFPGGPQVVPYISGEEEKLQVEYKKIMGRAKASGPNFFDFVNFPLSAHTNRCVIHICRYLLAEGVFPGHTKPCCCGCVFFYTYFAHDSNVLAVGIPLAGGGV